MNDVLEDVTSETVTKEHVVKRVDDWVDRLNALFAQVESWLPKGWHVERRRTELMDEKMMQRFKVKPRKVPVFDFKADDGRSASLEPRGLWIIGVNGRVDLVAGSKHFLIVDRAKSFAPPDWQIVNFHERQEVDRFNKTKLAAALAP